MTKPPLKFTYLTNPEKIYELSFQRIKEQVDLSSFPQELRPIIIRMIHSCGSSEIAKDIVYTQQFYSVTEQALRNEANIIVDSHMLKSSLAQKSFLKNRLVCTLDFPSIHVIAQQRNMTRSAISVEFWAETIEDAIVVIGNAPTALFHLLECLWNDKLAKPATIIATPVGFVGAAESKEALITYPPAPYLTLKGKKGGSAIAAGAINAFILRQFPHRHKQNL